MKKINDYLWYIEAAKDPLSSDVGIIFGKDYAWIYDVGASQMAEEEIEKISQEKIIILSHFHPDHTLNLNKISHDKLYVGDYTFKYTNEGNVVLEDVYINDGIPIHLFKIPSCHAKGSLALEVNEQYVFFGDALYPTQKGGRAAYNTQQLKEQIMLLYDLKAEYVLISHEMQNVQDKKEIIEKLEKIYSTRNKNEAYIYLS